MDAREQLRRYLEQRREMGESELVLDRMTVEETLAILGVRAGGALSTAAPATPNISRGYTAPAGTPREERDVRADRDERADSRDAAPIAPDSEPSRTGEPLPDVDWRQALRAAGASPETMPKKTTANGDAPASALDATGEPTREGAPPAKPPAKASAPSRANAALSSGATGAATPGTASVLSAPGSFVSPLSDTPSGLSVGASSGQAVGEDFAALDTLEKIVTHVAACTRCSLYATATNPVPGEGNPNADFMCVGEAPGATEDETGRPFIGAAGQLLTKILAAINLSREDVYICNVLKHRPPGNRNPLPAEVTACSPYLLRQIDLIKPKVILALGTFAAQTLLDTKLSIGKLRGQVHRYYGVPLIVTYHPAALLRNPGWKRPTWEDVQLAHRILNSATESKSGA